MSTAAVDETSFAADAAWMCSEVGGPLDDEDVPVEILEGRLPWPKPSERWPNEPPGPSEPPAGSLVTGDSPADGPHPGLMSSRANPEPETHDS